MVVLEADLVARGPNGERTIPATEFFTGPFTNALAPHELLTEIRVPAIERGVYLKYQRSSRDWATVGVLPPTWGGECTSGSRAWGRRRCGRLQSRKRSRAVPRRQRRPSELPRAPSRPLT